MSECFNYIYDKLLEIEVEVNAIGVALGDTGNISDALKDENFSGNIGEIKTTVESIKSKAEEDEIEVVGSIEATAIKAIEVKSKVNKIDLSLVSNKSSILSKIISLGDGLGRIANEVSEVTNLVPEGSDE